MGFSKLKIPRICEQCRNPFEAKTIVTRFCSHSCADRNGKERKKIEKAEKEKELILQRYADKIAILNIREYISVSEAVILFGISKDTIHRLIKRKVIHSVNLGQRLTRINRLHLQGLFSKVEYSVDENESENIDYNIDECYTLSEVSEKFGANPSTVSNAIRKYKIPKKKIGSYVYVPKKMIDKIFLNI